MWNLACERDAPDFCPPPSITGFSIGLYSDHSHHHVLCSHIYGWHSPHGHLVLLDKGKRKAWLQWLKKNKTLFTEHELFFLFFFFSLSAVQNKTKENPPPGPSLPVYDPPPDCSSHQLHDLQPRLAVCHVRQPEVPGAGESMWSGVKNRGGLANHLGSSPSVIGGVGSLRAAGRAFRLESFFRTPVHLIRPCSHYCEGPPFARLPSAWSDAAPLVCALRVWVCAPSRSAIEAASCLRSASETSYKQHN